MSDHYRVLRCINQGCVQHGAVHHVHATQVGPFLEWPNLRCVCGMEPMITIDTTTPK